MVIVERIGDYQLQIGKNKQENTELVKNADLNSIWIHLNGVSSASGIISSTENVKIPKKILYSFFHTFINHHPKKNCRQVIYAFVKNVKIISPGLFEPSNFCIVKV